MLRLQGAVNVSPVEIVGPVLKACQVDLLLPRIVCALTLFDPSATTLSRLSTLSTATPELPEQVHGFIPTKA